MSCARLPPSLRVVKRSGETKNVEFDKITHRLNILAGNPTGVKRRRNEFSRLSNVNVTEIVKEVIINMADMMTTAELDNLAARCAISRNSVHPEYEILARRIVVSNLHKNTPDSFTEACTQIYNCYTSQNVHKPLLRAEIYRFIMENAHYLNNLVQDSLDYEFNYFAVRTLESIYLHQADGKIIERPQYMYLRVAVEHYAPDLGKIANMYRGLANHEYTSATPTLFNSGSEKNQMASCFLLTLKEDSIDGIFETISDMANLGKHSGGIGLSLTGLRAKGSIIYSTQRKAKGVMSVLRLVNELCRFIDQGGKRKMSLALYIEPWHADILDFIAAKRNDGDEIRRARELFYAIWSNELLAKRAAEGKDWSLFCPKDAPGLIDSYGAEFEKLYLQYEKAGAARRTIPAIKLYELIADNMIETGGPYHLNKDACNLKSNQSNLGTLRGSNLCSEILIYSSTEEYGVCILASIALPKCIERDAVYNQEGIIQPGVFDFNKLGEIAEQVCENLNAVVGKNYYSLKECSKSSLDNRPIGIGVQGLADVFIRLGLPYESDAARELNRRIFETIYYHAVRRSMLLAREQGAYTNFAGSPLSRGEFQFDLWRRNGAPEFPLHYDWDTLRAQVMRYGVRNSLLVALMPTASTSLLLGNNESFEPITQNFFKRQTIAGTAMVLNNFLVRDMLRFGKWNSSFKDQLLVRNGSVQEFPSSLVSPFIKKLYKTVWEMRQKTLMDMSAERGQFVCQTQSLNLYFRDPSISKVTSALIYGMRQGLKTISYYTRTTMRLTTNKFTVSYSEEKKMLEAQEPEPEPEEKVCTVCHA